MSRFKFAVGLLVLAGVSILIAIAILNPNARSRAVREPGRKAMDHTRTGEAIANREKKPSAQPSESDAFLKSVVKSPGESDRTESSAPRMQRKQIKMH